HLILTPDKNLYERIRRKEKFKYGGKEKLKYAERIIDLYRSGKYNKLLTEESAAS
ncbi:9042_t:CDS:1, partial [Dentiscutata heterogama]